MMTEEASTTEAGKLFHAQTTPVYYIGRAEQNGRTEQNIKMDG